MSNAQYITSNIKKKRKRILLKFVGKKVFHLVLNRILNVLFIHLQCSTNYANK